MSYLRSQIRSIERKLNISSSHCPKVLVLSLEDPELRRTLPENVQEWLTYQQELRQHPNTDFVMMVDSAELIARGLPAKKLPAWWPSGCVTENSPFSPDSEITAC